MRISEVWNPCEPRRAKQTLEIKGKVKARTKEIDRHISVATMLD